MKTWLVLAGGCLFLTAKPLCASPEQGIVEPIEVRKSYAAAGDPQAQFNLGVAYGKGEGVAKDPAVSLQWFRKSAQAGFAPAQFALGVLYATGTDTPRDDKEALKWLALAGQQGVFEAQKLLIGFYTEGRGTPKSPGAALTWDFLARRTLELRHEKPAGEPPHPPLLRKDGSAEVVMKDGTKKILHPGGGEESVRGDGAKVIAFPDGDRKIIASDGAETTEHPGGFSETKYPDGRKNKRDPKGTSETTYPDGRTDLQGTGTDSRGRAVFITEARDKDGKKTGRTIVRGDVTIRENATGPFAVETLLKDKEGVAVKLTEEVRPDGKYGMRKLTRIDNGEEPKGTDLWTIRRTIEIKDGSSVEVEETYSSLGLGEQRVVEKKPVRTQGSFGVSIPPGNGLPYSNPTMPAAGGNNPMPSGGEIKTVVLTPPTVVRIFPVAQAIPNDDHIYKEDVKLEPLLKELEALELKAQNFAGATEPNWKSAKATAAAFMIPLPNLPQQQGTTSAWFIAKQMAGSKMLDVPFLSAKDDMSRQFPLGLHGREVIGRYRWSHAQTPHFVVHYVQEADAKLSMHYIEFAYSAVVSLLALDPQRGAQKGHVFLFPGDSEWRQYLAASQKDPRLGGFAYKDELLLPVVSGRREKEAASESTRTLCHEVTHAVVARFYSAARPPLWLNEGFAEYVAALTLSAKSGMPVDKFMSAKADRVMNVGDVFRRVDYGGNSAYAFYANSAWCVRTLCEKLPADGFPRFFNTITAGNSPEVAFRASYGVKCPDLRAFAALLGGWPMLAPSGGAK